MMIGLEIVEGYAWIGFPGGKVDSEVGGKLMPEANAYKEF